MSSKFTYTYSHLIRQKHVYQHMGNGYFRKHVILMPLGTCDYCPFQFSATIAIYVANLFRCSFHVYSNSFNQAQEYWLDSFYNFILKANNNIGIHKIEIDQKSHMNHFLNFTCIYLTKQGNSCDRCTLTECNNINKSCAFILEPKTLGTMKIMEPFFSEKQPDRKK